MIVVTGHLRVAPDTREAYLLTCLDVVRQGRAAPGCRDFSLSADLVDTDRIDVLEAWEDEASLAAFRGDGIPGEQQVQLLDVAVGEHDATPR